MQIHIQKQSDGKLKITINASSSKKPLVFELTPDQVKTLASLLGNAASADTFEFRIAM
jgi:hypothetical protein